MVQPITKGKNIMATFELTPKQEAHLNRIKQQFAEITDPKFRKGAEEHDTDLEEQPASLLLDFAIEEAIDQVVYLLTLKQVMEDKNAQNQPRQH